MDRNNLISYIESVRNKSIAVVGIGVSNRPLAELLLKNGCDVTVCDRRSMTELGHEGDKLSSLGAKFSLGEEYLSGLTQDIIFRTPGLHPFVPELIKARENGSLVTSEMEVFFSVCPCPIIAVTGSDGKTTTTTVISELLRAEGYTVHIGGNIGRPLLSDADYMDESDFAVLELSSFQLHSMNCRPDVAVITNVSPNHLDVHPSYEDYIESKKNIFIRQRPSDKLVINADNDITASFAVNTASDVRLFSRKSRVSSGAFAEGGKIFIADNGAVRELMKTSEIRLPGVHNVENYLAAFCATFGFVSDETRRKVAREFGGVEHRLELVRTLRGVEYCNDSIASSPTRTIAGLRSFDRKLILIAGGHDKHIPFNELGDEICRRVKVLYLCGETAEAIRDAVIGSKHYNPESISIELTENYEETVIKAEKVAEPGDVVLLSPACSSFDRFKNFVERGNTFKRIVNELE